MNNHQIRHVAQVLNVVAFAQFGVYGYAGLKTDPMDWLSIGGSLLVFLGTQTVATYLLGYVTEAGR